MLTQTVTGPKAMTTPWGTGPRWRRSPEKWSLMGGLIQIFWVSLVRPIWLIFRRFVDNADDECYFWVDFWQNPIV